MRSPLFFNLSTHRTTKVITNTTRERNWAVVAVIADMQRIITLYHGDQVVIVIVVIVGIALLRAQAVDIILHVDIIAVLGNGFEPPAVFPPKQQSIAIGCGVNHRVIMNRLIIIRR